MQCIDVADLLVAYQDGEVTAAERAAVALHLLQCPACREEEQMLTRLDGVLDSWTVPEPAADFVSGVMARVSSNTPRVVPLRRPTPSWLRSSGVARLATAVAVLMLAFVTFVPHHAPSPSGHAVLDEVVRSFDAGRDVAVLDDLSLLTPSGTPAPASELHAILDPAPASASDEVLDDILSEQKDKNG